MTFLGRKMVVVEAHAMARIIPNVDQIEGSVRPILEKVYTHVENIVDHTLASNTHLRFPNSLKTERYRILTCM